MKFFNIFQFLQFLFDFFSKKKSLGMFGFCSTLRLSETFTVVVRLVCDVCDVCGVCVWCVCVVLLLLVVVVVQTLLYDMCVSPYTPKSMQLIRGCQPPRETTPGRLRHPAPVLMTGAPSPVPVYRVPKTKELRLWRLHELCA